MSETGFEPTGKHPGGRPPKWPNIDLGFVRELAESGQTDAQMAVSLRIAESTLYDYKLKWPEFSEAIKEGKSNPDDQVERSLFERAVGFEHVEEKVFCHEGVITKEMVIKKYAPDTTAAIFWLCNRRPKKFKHVSHIQHSGPDGGSIPLSITEEEKANRLKKLRRVQDANRDI